MTTIYLIRHAEAEGNLYRIAQGQHESSLTDRGRRQVQALERRFAGVRIDAVYASDLYRTRATAAAIYKPKGLPLHPAPGLREICVGDWEGRTWGDIARQYPQEMADFGSRMDRWSIPGAETPAQVLERALGALGRIAVENEGRAAAVFSHGYVIRLVLAKLQGISLRDTGDKSPTGDNTAVSCLEWDGASLRVVWQNDNSHLLTPEFLAGEKVRKRANALEPGLYFAPVRLPEQAALLSDLTAASWEGEPPVPDPACPALAGYLGEEPVGLSLKCRAAVRLEEYQAPLGAREREQLRDLLEGQLRARLEAALTQLQSWRADCAGLGARAGMARPARWAASSIPAFPGGVLER